MVRSQVSMGSLSYLNGQGIRSKRLLLQNIVTASQGSVLWVRGDDSWSSGDSDAYQATGQDAAATAIDMDTLTPDLRRISSAALGTGDTQGGAQTPASVVVSLDFLVHQSTLAEYRRSVRTLSELAQHTLIIAAHDCPPVRTLPTTFYHEPITKTLAEFPQFTEVSVVGKYRDDMCVVVARKHQPSGHFRDITAADFNVMSAITDYPLLLRTLVDVARGKLGFFPAQPPRGIEYPWVLAKMPADLSGRSVLDVGTGINPLPLVLAQRGASVFTVDSHSLIRDLASKEHWNEWGFLDYSTIDRRISSIHSPYEDWSPSILFDSIYSVSVIEHVPAEIRRAWIKSFAHQLKSGGDLLLTLDLFAESNNLRNFSEGQIVEPEDQHGSLYTVAEELQAVGFAISECVVKRNIPRSRIDTGFIHASLSFDGIQQE